MGSGNGSSSSARDLAGERGGRIARAFIEHRITAAIGEASKRYATFRRFIATIDASDSYVYVSEGDCGHGVRACFVSVTSSESHRLFIRVDSRKIDSAFMGLIGHELRHTIEVIGEPSVKNNAAKYLFYERTSTHGITATHETRAAVNAGNIVRAEVEKFNRPVSTRGTNSARP